MIPAQVHFKVSLGACVLNFSFLSKIRRIKPMILTTVCPATYLRDGCCVRHHFPSGAQHQHLSACSVTLRQSWNSFFFLEAQKSLVGVWGFSRWTGLPMCVVRRPLELKELSLLFILRNTFRNNEKTSCRSSNNQYFYSIDVCRARSRVSIQLLLNSSQSGQCKYWVPNFIFTVGVSGWITIFLFTLQGKIRVR